MIGMAELSGGQTLPLRVEFSVWRRHHDGFGVSELKQHSLEGRQTWWIEMFNDLDHGSSVEAGQSSISVDQRSVNQFDPFPLFRWKPVIAKSLHSPLENLHRNVEADDSFELSIIEEMLEEPALTATQVENTASTACTECR